MKTLFRFVIGLLLLASPLSAWAQSTATVQLDSVWGCPGQIVEVPLRVFGLNQGVTNFDFTFRLNTDILEPVLLIQDTEQDRSFPLITGTHEVFAGQRGGLITNARGGDIMVSWFDRSAGQLPSVQLADGDTLFMLNVRINQQPTTPEPITIHLVSMHHMVSHPHSQPYTIVRRNGYVLAKSPPDVRIDRTFFDNPRYTQLTWPAADPRRMTDVTLCVNEPFQLKATGAERFEWRSLLQSQAGVPPERLYLLMDRTDVYNPVLTIRDADWLRTVPVPRVDIPHGLFMTRYDFEVRGFNSDGCFGTDTVRVMIDQTIRHPLVEQPTHIIVERGETLDLALELEPMPRRDLPDWEDHWAPQIIRWFPHDLIRDPKEVIQWTQEPIGTVPRVVKTQTAPIYESTWIWAEVRQLPLHIADTSLARAINTRQGCVQFLNIRVDIKGEMFNARISAMNPDNLQEYDYFCGTPGVTEQRTMLAALVEGGSGRRSYHWTFRSLYSGQEPILADEFANPTEIIFFGTTEVSVTIFDSVSEQEITLYHTITVETPKTLSVNIAMDDASQRFFEMGFCQTQEMPLTLVATVDNQGAHYQIFWEETRLVHTPEGIVYRTYRVHNMEGHVANFPFARAGSVYRAVVESQDRCVTQHTVWSNDIDPQSQWFDPSGVFLIGVSQQGCNTAPSEIRFRAFNPGINPLFHIYRNGELLEEYMHQYQPVGTAPIELTRPVQSLNYWDRFSVRFTNQSARCLRHPYVMSNEVTPNIPTTNRPSQGNVGNIVSIFGGDEVCNTTEGVFTFHLENMEQFSRDATVIWKINGNEWGRYEFDPTIASALSRERPDGSILINERLRIDEHTPFTDSMAFAQRYAFHFNTEGFPKIGTDFRSGDRLSVTVITRVMCSDVPTGIGGFVIREASITPNFIDIQDAVLTVTQDNLNVCRGDRIEFATSLEHINPSAGVMSWFLNGNRVGEGATFTLNHALNNDEVVVVFESNFACAPNLPLRETRVIEAHDVPTLALLADTLICYGETLQLYAETNAETFLWTGNNLSNATVKNPTATLPGLNTPHDFTVVVTDERGCQSTASITVRTAPKDEIRPNIWLENPADTAICRNQVILFRSIFSPINASVPFERVWLRNGLATHNTGPELATSAFRDGDVWQMQIAMPTLNTCMPRVVRSNPIEIRVNPLIEVSVALELHPEIHLNNCENETGAYLFVATPGVTDAGRFPRFDWYINDNRVAFQIVNAVAGTTPQTTWGRNLQPGDAVHVVLTTEVENCRRLIATSSPISIVAGPIVPSIDGHLICFGEATTLTIENPQDNQTYRWYSSLDNFQTVIGTCTTLNEAFIATYRVVVTAENNCERTVYVDVEQGMQPQARITLLTSPSEIRTREPIRFRNDATGWTRAYWQFGNGNGEIEHHGSVVEHEFENIQNYEVALRVVSMDGCEAKYSLSLDVQPSMDGIFVPTAFMPNSTDPRNSHLKVFATDQNPIVALRFSVFAMDGRELFTTNDPNRGWDGRYNGREMPTGNYSWMVSARLSSGEEIVRSGVATLVR